MLYSLLIDRAVSILYDEGCKRLRLRTATGPGVLLISNLANQMSRIRTMKTIRKKRVFARLHDDKDGSVLLEATFVMPILAVFLAGITEWGLAFYQYNQLSTATGSAVRQLIVSRGYDTPYTDVLSQYSQWAGQLKVKGSNLTITINGTTCTDNATCKTALNGALGKSATISVNYACNLQFTPAVASPCPLQLAMTGLVE